MTLWVLCYFFSIINFELLYSLLLLIFIIHLKILYYYQELYYFFAIWVLTPKLLYFKVFYCIFIGYCDFEFYAILRIKINNQIFFYYFTIWNRLLWIKSPEFFNTFSKPMFLNQIFYVRCLYLYFFIFLLLLEFYSFWIF